MSTPEILALLAQFELTQALPEALREQLAAATTLTRLPIGQTVAHPNREQRLFLVDGQVRCQREGRAYTMASEQGVAAPVELLTTSLGGQMTIKTLTPCAVLYLPYALLKTLQRQAVDAPETVHDNAEDVFLTQLQVLIDQDRLELPARPEVVLRIQQLTTDPNVGVKELVDIIQRDATLAGALLHATNSARFRAVKEISSVRDAVLRLGFDNTRMLATNLALRHVFKAQHHATREAMQTTWSDSVLYSAFSYLLAERLRILNRERALLAGLIAGIGAVPIIQFVEKHDKHPLHTRIEQLLLTLRGRAGAAVINYWKLGADLMAVAEHIDNWEYHAAQPDYASIVLVARWATENHLERPCPDPAQIPAFAVLGMQTPTAGEWLHELEGSESAFQTLQNMFAASSLH